MSLYTAIIFTFSLHGLTGFALNLVVLAIIGIGLLWLLLRLVRQCSELNSDAIYALREAEREVVIEPERDHVDEDPAVVAPVSIKAGQ